ncbi:hypothetical protein UlMin_001576 [Ulmus minor]
MGDFFPQAGLARGDSLYKYYQVKKNFYASSSFLGPTCRDIPRNPDAVAGDSKWLGYVAVANDEGKKELGRRDILIAFRGTQTAAEACVDADTAMVSAAPILGRANNPRCHSGFYKYYTTSDAQSKYNKTSCRDQILSSVRSLVNQYKNEQLSITVAGHSLGAALALLCATDLARNGYNKPQAAAEAEPDCTSPSGPSGPSSPSGPSGPSGPYGPTGASSNIPITAFPFACPRLGDAGYGKVFDSLNPALRSLRITNKPDPVPRVPPAELGFVHVGPELLIDTSNSPYLKTTDPTSHLLEVYLHGLSSTQGTATANKRGRFEFVLKRDISLINKHSDALKDKYLVDPYWWTEKDKGMVQLVDGNWKLRDREADRHREDDEDNDLDEDEDDEEDESVLIPSRL